MLMTPYECDVNFFFALMHQLLLWIAILFRIQGAEQDEGKEEERTGKSNWK